MYLRSPMAGIVSFLVDQTPERFLKYKSFHYTLSKQNTVIVLLYLTYSSDIFATASESHVTIITNVDELG